jgi:histone deacetylase 6
LNLNNKKKRSYDFQAHGDNDYIYIYNRIIHPIIKEFNPDFILVSSGFDAARKDYLGGFTLTPNAYYYMTRKLNTFDKPILCVLEGGYHLISTAQSATAVVQGLIEEDMLPEPVKNISYNNIHTKCHVEKEYH